MAGIALLAESTLVHVLRLVAIDALAGGLVERLGAVTLRSAHDIVQTQQGKTGQVVVKTDVAFPACFGMLAPPRPLPVHSDRLCYYKLSRCLLKVILYKKLG